MPLDIVDGAVQGEALVKLPIFLWNRCLENQRLGRRLRGSQKLDICMPGNICQPIIAAKRHTVRVDIGREVGQEGVPEQT